MMPSMDLPTVSSFFPNLSLVEKMIIDTPAEPLLIFQNAVLEREKISKSKNNKPDDTHLAGDSEEASVSGVDVVTGESSKPFGGKRDDVVGEAMERAVVGADSISRKGKGKEISS